MFLLYSVLFVSAYVFYKNRSGVFIPNGPLNGPLNPIDDMPVRIGKHVMSCISTVPEPIEDISPPSRKSWKESSVNKIKELPYRRQPQQLYQGMDGRLSHFNLEPDKEEETINKIRFYLKCQNVLQTLEDPNVNVLHKIELWNTFRKTFDENEDKGKYIPNIFSGGLMKGWEEDANFI